MINREKFIKEIKGDLCSGAEYEMALFFDEKPSEQDLLNKLQDKFSVFHLLNKKQLNLFESRPDFEFMEDNKDFLGWKYTAKINLNILFDDLTKDFSDNYQDLISVYRFENKEGAGVYRAGLARLISAGEAPFDDPSVSTVFGLGEDQEYQKQWLFGFKDRKQISFWVENANVLAQEMDKVGLNFVEIKVNKNKILIGSEQLIFKKTDMIRKKVINFLDFMDENKLKIKPKANGLKM